jgi:hypothetical protein
MDKINRGPPTDSRSVQPGLVVLFDYSSSVVNSITLHTHSPESTLGLDHVMLSGQEGVLPLI